MYLHLLFLSLLQFPKGHVLQTDYDAAFRKIHLTVFHLRKKTNSAIVNITSINSASLHRYNKDRPSQQALAEEEPREYR